MTDMTTTLDTKQADTTTVPAVKAFMKILNQIHAFKAKHPRMFTELTKLQSEYNPALQAADAVVRDREVSCGPFQLLRYVSTFDAAGIAGTVGEDDFVRIGGAVEIVKSISAADVRKAVKCGNLDKKIAEKYETKTPHYKRIPPMHIP